MPRQHIHIPNRRHAVLATVDHAGSRYEVAVGVHADDTVGELFISGVQSGSDIDPMPADAACLFHSYFGMATIARILRGRWVARVIG